MKLANTLNSPRSPSADAPAGTTSSTPADEVIRAIVEASSDVMFAKDLQGRIEYANPATVALIGKPLERILGRTDHEFLDDQAIADRVRANDRHVMDSGESIKVEEVVPGPDGAMRIWWSQKLPRRDANGHIVGMVGVSRDITDRKLLEQARERSDAEHRFVLDRTFAAVVVHDARGAITLSNPMASELLGLSVDQLHGRSPADPGWHFLREDGAPMPVEDFPVSIVARTKQPLQDYVVGVVRSAGADVNWALVNAHPEVDAHGCLVRTIVSFVDITNRKIAQKRLEDADHRKDEFLAMLAHELRNPLAPISAAAQLLQLAPGDAANVSGAAAIISRQVGHMAKLVDDLLDVSRVSRGLVELNLEPLDLGSVVLDAVEQVRPLVDAKQHTLAVWTGPELLPLMGDRTRLIQVLTNLLTNAAKYTPAGGSIELRAGITGDSIEITVADDGSGIDADLLPYIFDLFTQGKRSLDRSQGGLGIGLALVKNAINLHGGRVWVESRGENQGSSFHVSLPRQVEAVRPD